MKKLFTLLFVLIGFANTYAQFEDVYADPNLAGEFVFVDDDLYVFTGNTLSKIDVTSPMPTATPVFTGLNTPYGMALGGDILYFAERGMNRILSFNTTDSIPALKEVCNTGLSVPARILLAGTDLYIAGSGTSEIVKVDVTAPLPTTPESVVSVSAAVGMELVGDSIYVCLASADKIARFSINDPAPVLEDVITSGLNFPHSLLLVGDEMYVSNTSLNSIVKFNINDANPTLTTVYYPDAPLVLRLRDGRLHVRLRDEDKIVRTEEVLYTSTTNAIISSKLKLYPNPSSDFIVIKGLENYARGSILNLLGQEVANFEISPDETIDVRNLETGTYLIKIAEQQTLKLVKQ